MKKLIYSMMLGLALWIPAYAQQDKNSIESVRVAYITQKLDLTAEESQKFWPVYNTYQEGLKQLVVKKNQQRKAYKKSANAPVDELEIEGEILTLRKRYLEEFMKVLPRKKASMVYPAEREFRHQLIEHLKARKGKN